MVLLDAELFCKYLSFVHAFEFITSIFLSLFAGIFVSILAILSWMSRTSRENGPKIRKTYLIGYATTGSWIGSI